jgi:hypothetical protein
MEKTSFFESNIIRGIKSRRITWAGYVTFIEEMRNAYSILVENSHSKKSRNIYVYIDVDRKLVLKWDFEM